MTVNYSILLAFHSLANCEKSRPCLSRHARSRPIIKTDGRRHIANVFAKNAVFLGGRGAKWGMSNAMLTSNEFVFTFGGSYVCANFGENKSRNRESAHKRIHRYTTDSHTDRRKPVL